MARRAQGETREAILDATLRLLGEHRDASRVTIDAVVGEVGCTPPTLYYYFPTKDELLVAACQREYESFAAEITTVAGHTADPLADLVNLGAAYLNWAWENPALYQLLFMTQFRLGAPAEPTPPDFSTTPGLADLIAVLARCRDEAGLRIADLDQAALVFWGIVHGFAALGVINPDVPAELLAESCRIACTGAILAYR